MKGFLIALAFCVFLSSCRADEPFECESYVEKSFYVKEIKLFNTAFEEDGLINEETEQENDKINGIWVSQFDMHPIFRDGSKQRQVDDYREKVETMVENLVRDGFNTIFLQVRPNGDSFVESEFYPYSKYLTGAYGGGTDYDAIEIFLDIAKKSGLSVHAWINPFRLCSEDELLSYGRGLIYEWYCEGLGKRIERGGDGLLYLDPSYSEATELIVNGARELILNYDFDGIHIDDYFYPTEFEFDDEREFLLSGYSDIGEFRRDNINRTVKALLKVTHETKGKVFGVAPAGNIYSLENGWYVDIYEWLSVDGYIDYIMPQLYFGFLNASCPFERILKDWCDALKSDSVKLYIGLSAAKCELGSKGFEDAFAGESGKNEWAERKDILARSYKALIEAKADGFCIFTYSSFYDPLSGKANEYTIEERSAFVKAIKEATV